MATKSLTWEEISTQAKDTNTPKPWVDVPNPDFPKVEWGWCFHDSLMFGDIPCPFLCEDGMFAVKQTSGDDTRTIHRGCVCSNELKWKRKTIEQVLPPRYHRSNLYTLKPSPASKMSLERQQGIFDYLRNKDNRDKSYLLFGAPGTGKTTCATALIRRAIERDWSPWFWRDNSPLIWKQSMWIRYVNWDGLMGEFLASQNDREAPKPSVTAQLIREAAVAGRKPVICLEEIDKSRLTEFKANKLFDIVQAVDAVQGQLIITTNHRSKESFQKWLYQTDNDAVNMAGEPVWRRIVDNCKIIECKAE